MRIVAAVGVWRDAPWWPLGLAMTALASLVLSAAWWPVARIGVAVNVALLMLVIGLRFGGG